MKKKSNMSGKSVNSSAVIQANPEFVNGKHFQDLVDIINSYKLDIMVSSPMIRDLSHFIGFKDENMQNIADRVVNNSRHNILS